MLAADTLYKDYRKVENKTIAHDPQTISNIFGIISFGFFNA